MPASGAIRAPGESVDVNAKRVPYFKPGKEMRERLNFGEVSAEYERARLSGRGRIRPCGRGGTGRRNRLKIGFPERECGFKSRRPHQLR